MQLANRQAIAPARKRKKGQREVEEGPVVLVRSLRGQGLSSFSCMSKTATMVTRDCSHFLVLAYLTH